MSTISATALAALLSTVAAAQTVEASALATITGLKQSLATALEADGADTSVDTEVGKLLALLDENTTALAAAIPANTPVDPAATPASATAPSSAGAGTVAITVTGDDGVVTTSQVHSAGSDVAQAVVAAVTAGNAPNPEDDTLVQ